MDLRGLLATDDAVSPVIGVILMVAVTVILAAVVALFAGGFGEKVRGSGAGPDGGPTRTAFDYDFTDNGSSAEDKLVMTLTAGEIAEDKQDLYIVSSHGFEDDKYTGGGNTFECEQEYVCPMDFDDESGIRGKRMNAGESYTIFALNPGTEFERATVRIVYRSPDGQTSRTLAKWAGPDAA